ncbi:TIGR03899 family protein [Ferrimonas sediminicola]|uniref:TIGR03899 family protein n=1 Tax=Ferrimonas sediminicola TaxID=2569538 RepID=A0A4U1BIX6_9GAMM|nr:TIGR03899 family protein [Ferrimonas sediminicola]TKB51466.1 TIGR03899 family protein [Ferrimonas sediminicola]
MTDKIIAAPPKREGSRTARQQAVTLARRIGLTGNDADTSGALAQRTEVRLKNWQEQRQLNLESVIKQVIGLAGNAVSNKELDPDWQFQFCQLAEQIHHPSMQKLWAQILATELSLPGSFGLRTLETLKGMTQREAMQFARTVTLSCQLNGDPSHKVVTGYRREAGFGGLSSARQESLNLSGQGLPYSAILTLRDLGLLFATELETGPLPPKHPLVIRCQGHNMTFLPKSGRLRLRYYRFTQVGDELARLITEPANEEYCAALTKLLLDDFTPQ